ncbi:MAG TPA: LD-carboxypeptidase [Fimbriimonas sp.]
MKPRALQPGSTIALVSPASPLSEDKLEFMTRLLEGEGYRVVRGRHVLDADDYLAGSDEDRAEDLMGAFGDPVVDAVLATRGGYGCARLFPHLDLDRMAASRKLFLGFSDVTTLHLALNRRGLPTVHAPMALTLHYPREAWVYDSLLRVLRGDLEPPEAAPRGTTATPGRAEGVVVGGCMCLLADSIGTPEAFDGTDRIVVLEDVDEAPHRIDAMLTHMLNAGILQGARGIVVGEMTRTDERVDEGIGGKPWKEIFDDRLGPLGIPTVYGYPLGHMKGMLSLPLGIQARLDADAGTLSYLEPLFE